MLSGLLNLALLGAVPAGYPGEPALSLAPTPQIQVFLVKSATWAVLGQLAADGPRGERDYINESDNSNEPTSARERPVESCGSTTRSARSRFRAKLQHAAATSPGAPRPLFYTFCTLLI